jgi:hypothetical protein
MMFEDVETPAPVRRPHAIPAAALAVLLALTADLLLRGWPWGINAPLWTALFLGAAIFLIYGASPQPPAAVAIAATGALIASAGLAWRASPVLVTLDVLLLLFFLASLALSVRGVRIWATGLLHVVAALLFTALLAVPGMFQLLFMDVRWRELRPGKAGQRAWVVARGLLIAFPALLVFGLLLTSADEAFAKLLADVFRIDLSLVLSHTLLTLLLIFPIAGVLRAMLYGASLPEFARPSFLRLGAAELNIAIGLVDVLFAAFVAVQFRYFFGGAALVAVAPKLTYAQYARHGFFELVWVVALVVPMLLIADWLIDRTHTRGLNAFRLLAFVQVLLVGVILVSAWRRMHLYVNEYGLTELRVYTTAFMLWLAALLVCFIATVLTGHRAQFLVGALAAGVAVVVGLHAVNPDDLIVRTNVARAASGVRALDAPYARSLSADAAPALIAAFPRLVPCGARDLLRVDDDVRAEDWRSWNVSRVQAKEAIAPRRVDLTALAQQCHPPDRH